MVWAPDQNDFLHVCLRIVSEGRYHFSHQWVKAGRVTAAYVDTSLTKNNS